MGLKSFLAAATGLMLAALANQAADARAEAPVLVYTHGEGKFAMLQPDGSLKGPGVDLLACTMQAMGQPYRLSTVSMARAYRLEAEGRDHIWFPTYDSGDPERATRLVGPIGSMAIYWFYKADRALTPGSPDFARDAKVTAFPGSRPEAMLKAEGYRLITGTDDENRLLLMLVEGRVDAILAADFRDTLATGAADLATGLEVRLKVKLPVAFEFSQGFLGPRPGFKRRMQAALDGCRR